jgi:hypothetical protein
MSGAERGRGGRSRRAPAWRGSFGALRAGVRRDMMPWRAAWGARRVAHAPRLPTTTASKLSIQGHFAPATAASHSSSIALQSAVQRVYYSTLSIRQMPSHATASFSPGALSSPPSSPIAPGRTSLQAASDGVKGTTPPGVRCAGNSCASNSGAESVAVGDEGVETCAKRVSRTSH